MRSEPDLERDLSAREREAYLARIGLAGPRPPAKPNPGAAFLLELHRAHLGAVPFENLDIHLGVPIELDVGGLVAKLVARRRGGFCYELNGAFAALLRSLGFEVSLLEARVFGLAGPGMRFDHLCLAVELQEGDVRLADVGFGECFRAPLPLCAGAEQADESGTYRLEPASERELDLFRDGEPQYRLDTTPRALADFAPGCRHHQVSPESHFTRNTIASRPTAEGRVTLRGLRLIETAGARRTETDVAPGELGRILSGRFGIELERDELVHLVGRMANSGR